MGTLRKKTRRFVFVLMKKFPKFIGNGEKTEKFHRIR